MVWLNFVVSYSLFPGVMLIKQYTFISAAWNNTILVCVYNFFGTLGKLLAIFPIYKDISMTILVIFRFSFYFTFLSIAHSSSDSFAGQYWVSILNISFFAFSEGYAMSSHLNLYPNKLKT
jgi:hypothetical protein